MTGPAEQSLDSASETTGVIEWSLTPAESRFLRLPMYAFVGTVGGMLLVLVIGGAVALITALLAGNIIPVALVALLVLVGGPLSLLYLWPMIRDSDQRPAPSVGLPSLSLPGAILAALLGGLAIMVSAQLNPTGPLVVLAVGLGSPVLVPFLGSKGHVDPETGVLSVNGRSVPLASLAAVHSVSLWSAVGYWLNYTVAPLGAPRWVVVPKDVASDLEVVLDEGVAAEPPDSRSQPLALRITLVVFGAGCFAVAGALWWAGGQYAESPVVLLPGVGLATVFGGLFVWLAVRR